MMNLLMFVLFTFLCAVKSARILGIFPMPAPSHYLLGSALMRALAERGHDVTVVSPFGEKNPPKNGTYRDIILTGSYEEMLVRLKERNMFNREDISPISETFFLNLMMLDIHEKVLAHKNVQRLINSKNETFDVVIVEQFMNDAHKGFAAHFKAPLIISSTLGANFYTDLILGNPSPPSYISDFLLNYPSPMSFYQRLCSSFFILYKYLHYLYIFPQQNKMMKKYFPNTPELEDIVYNTSIMLLNSHPSINKPVPYVPNMIDIGGFHIQPPKKLPNDLQEFLDSAKHGVIYFSMGSNLKSSDLPAHKRDAFISAFSELKQKVLWKWEDDSLPNKPENVKLGKWLPQQDILAHPNLKLFITHCGLLSTTETVYHGVPILAIPIFGDQRLNAQIAINNGFGLSLPYGELSKEKLSEKLHELLENPKYGSNAKERSRIFHDRPVKPIDLATYWVEYVIRHRGAPHLRVSGLDLPWYQYHLLDVIAFCVLTCLIILIVGIFIIRKVFCKLCAKMCITKDQNNEKKLKKA